MSYKKKTKKEHLKLSKAKILRNILLLNILFVLLYRKNKNLRGHGRKTITRRKVSMNKKTFIRRAYKAIQNVTSKKYYDECWQGVKNVVEGILSADSSITMYLKNATYEGNIGENGHRKVYRYTVAGCDKNIDMQIIASFCGTVADPMSAYDITVLMN